MARTVKMLAEPGQLGAAAAAIYTVPSNTKAILQRLTLCNVTAGAITVDLHIVKSGDSAAADNKLVDEKSLAAGESVDITSVLHTLEAGDSLQGLASSATSITYILSGVEVT